MDTGEVGKKGERTMGRCWRNEETAMLADLRGQETDSVREGGRHDTVEISFIAIRSLNLAQINTLSKEPREPASRLTVELCRYYRMIQSTAGMLRAHIAQIVVTVDGKSC